MSAARPVIWPWPPVSAIPTCKESSSILRRSLPLARELVGATKVAGRIEVVAGDFFADPAASGGHLRPGADLARLARGEDSPTAHQDLRRLPPGGGVLIMEKLIDEDRRGPVWALMQSLNMLTLMDGKERTLSEYEMLLQARWLRRGLRQPECDATGCRAGVEGWIS